jgi:hypothetical protein
MNFVHLDYGGHNDILDTIDSQPKNCRPKRGDILNFRRPQSYLRNINISGRSQ